MSDPNVNTSEQADPAGDPTSGTDSSGTTETNSSDATETGSSDTSATGSSDTAGTTSSDAAGGSSSAASTPGGNGTAANPSETAATPPAPKEGAQAAAGNAATNGNAAAAPPSPPPTPPTKEEALRDAFTLGWGIVELRSRIKAAQYKSSESGMRLASVWRAGFNRIAALQTKAFTTNSTAGTLYEAPGKDVLPYLYPPEPDYSNVTPPDKRISNYPTEGIVVPNDVSDRMSGFGLYEVTRRAINCLTLLYVKEEESLIPDKLKKNQAHLIRAILEARKKKASGGGDENAQPDAPPPEDKVDGGGENTTSGAPQGGSEAAGSGADDLQTAKETLTERIGKFLDAWDGYLRENYYADGSIPNNDLELVAYEAGNSMCSLSWGIGVATAEPEQKAEAAAQQARAAAEAAAQQQPQETAPQQEGEKEEKKEKEEEALDPSSVEIIGVWQKVFRAQDVIRLQHQITALSSALDDEYYAKEGAPPRPADGAAPVTPNPDLPSQTIQAVKRSLDYWQNTVKWIAEPGSLKKLRPSVAPDAAHWSKSMRLALNEQSNIWQTLMTGQQTLRAYSMESVTHDIMQDITGEIQKGLRSGFSENVRKAEDVALGLAKEAKEAFAGAREAAMDGLEQLLGVSRWWVIGAVAVVLLVCLVFIFAAVLSGDKSGAINGAGGAGVGGLLSAAMGYLGLKQLQQKTAESKGAVAAQHDAAETTVVEQATTTSTASADAGAGTNLLTRIEGVAGQAGTKIVEAITNGYEQARIELDSLGRSVAVAYPLVEFFGTNFELGADVKFLTKIIWSKAERNEEIARVTRAAFGSLAVFITPSAEGPKDDDDDNDDGKPKQLAAGQPAGQPPAGTAS